MTDEMRRKNKLVKLPRSEWTIIENCHESLKTQDEHDKMLLLLKERKTIPDVVTKGVYLLSGLVYCSKCNHAILMQKRESSKGIRTVTKGCQYRDPYGIKCFNKAVETTVLEEATLSEMEEYEQRLMEKSFSPDLEATLNHKISEKQKEIDKVNKGIERIMQMYEDGDYSREVYQNRMSTRKEQLNAIEDELQQLTAQFNQISQTTNEQRLSQLRTFRELVKDNKDVKTLNEAMRKIIQRVEYLREDKENIKINVIFH